jgi:hypothetical protein
MRQYIDTLQDVQGNALVGATVLVQNYIGGANASIFSDNGLTPILTSTVSTGADGQFSFFAADGNYNLVMSKNSTIFKTQSPVVLFDGAAQLTFSDTGAANAYAVSNSDLEKALRSGLRVSVLIANTNTGASTFQYNALAVKPIVLPGGGALSGGQLIANGIYRLEYDGTNWEINGGASAALPNYPITAAEVAASVTPVNYQYAAGNILRYGTNTTPGTTNMLSALQAAVAQAANTGAGSAPAYLPGAQIYYINGTVSVPALAQTLVIYGDGDHASVIYQHVDAHVFSVVASTAGARLVVRNLDFVAIVGSAMATGAAIKFVGTNAPPVRTLDIRNVSFQGSAAADEFKYGIYMTNVNQANIDNSIFNGVVGSGSSEHIHFESDAGNISAIAALINNCCTYNANYGLNAANFSNPGIENLTVTNGEHVGVVTGIIVQNTLGIATYVEPKVTILNVHINSTSYCVYVSQFLQVSIGAGCVFYRNGNLNNSAFIQLVGCQEFEVDVITQINDSTDCPAVTLDGTTTLTAHGIIDGVFSGKASSAFPVVNANVAAGVASASQTVATPGVFTTAAQSFVAGQPVYLTGSAPGGFSLNTTYYVIAAGLSSTSCELSATSGGSGIQCTSSAACTLNPQSLLADIVVRGVIRTGYTHWLPALSVNGNALAYAPGGAIMLQTPMILSTDTDSFNATITPTGTTPNLQVDASYAQGSVTINAASGTVATILGNRPSQRITFGCTSAGVILANNAGQFMPGGANYTFGAGQTIDLSRQASSWTAVGRQ